MVTKTLMNENLINEKVTLSNYAFNKNVNASTNLPMKINFSESTSISSFSNKIGKSNNSREQTSPYLNCTKVQIISKMTEKKIFQKKPTDVTSSFTQAYKIYNTSSDELKPHKSKSKKDKLSRKAASKELTNGQQTVSDMNESEYHIRVDTNRRCKRKRRPVKTFGRPNPEDKKFEFYNGDLMCYPVIKTDKKQFNQDKRYNSKMQKTNGTRQRGDPVRPGDLWTLLRSINKFPYITSPRLSEDSIETIKRKGNFIKSNQKETGLIETCTTEEFSYISSYDIKSKSQSICSKPSSFDRVTIVNRKGDSKFKKTFKHPVPNDRSSRISKKNVTKNRCNVNQKANKKIIQTADVCGIENKNENFLDCESSSIFQNAAKEPFHQYSGQRKNEAPVSYIELIDNTNSEDETLSQKKIEYIQNETPLEENKFHESKEPLSSISSKAGLKYLTDIKISDKSKNVLEHKRNGFLKENRCFSKQCLDSKRNTFPKLTQTEIRRRLVGLKFPITILAKDELSSAFRLVDCDPPQFEGLSQHMWPYMTEWSPNIKGNKTLENHIKNPESLNHQTAFARKDSHNEMSNRNSLHNFISNGVQYVVSKKKESKTSFQSKDMNYSTPVPPKKKVLNQFKDKMIDLIYNKPQKNLVNKNIINCSRCGILKPINHNVESKIPLDANKQNEKHKELCDNFSNCNKPQTPNKYPWSKAKWASDFIDNIIKKIKKGTYYTQNDLDHENITTGAEVTTPVVKVETIPEDENVNQEVLTNDTDNATIPGFDDNNNVLPLKVEVKMMTSTLVSVHHSLTNVMLQFDICIPSVSEATLSSALPSFSSVITSENRSMLYKCKNSIPNAMLPAELCSILPKFLSQIMKNKAFTEIHNTPFNGETKANQIVPRIIFYPVMQLSSELQSLITGKFARKDNSDKIYSTNMDWCQTDILLQASETKPLLDLSESLCKYIKFHSEQIISSEVTRHEQRLTIKALNTCTALIPYVSPFSTIRQALGLNDLENIFSGLVNFIIGVSQRNAKSVIPYNCCVNISNDLRRMFNPVPKFSMILSISNIPYKIVKDENHNKSIETKKIIHTKGNHEVIKKCVRKTYVKLHKKCKSLTSMPRDSCSTSLDKITNVDDFFHALGCFKTLSKVIMGHSDKAILSSIAEMRSWIKEITQSQALLVLLLSNKKETTNLRRFRPMLLQGIAVNRITTAAELDMEIEVIEKENLCISQNEGISFLSQSNDNSLLDELCWIAKTTASDYQKTFDDSSERLLKSLLGKRKKLNPSYLRVMARYVGLGLLKHRAS